jgi:hypothetical protein
MFLDGPNYYQYLSRKLKGSNSTLLCSQDPKPEQSDLHYYIKILYEPTN